MALASCSSCDGLIPARARAVEHLYEAMLPGSYICLGHTESMGRISDRFQAVRFPEAVVYRRPEAS